MIDPQQPAVSGYVVKPDPNEKHKCALPAEWVLGAIWRCPEGHLWRCSGAAWWPAIWWTRLARGGRRAHIGMANTNRVKPRLRSKPAAPPNGGSGVSQSKDGRR